MTDAIDHVTLFGERNGAPPVVLGHAVTTDRSTVEPTAVLLGRDRHVLTWDARGHGGRSAPEGGFSYADLAGDLLAVLDHFEIESAVVGGVSQGAFVALELGLAHAERVAGLVLIACQAATEPPEVIPPQRAAVRRWAAEGLDHAHAHWMAEMNFGADHPGNPAWVEYWMARDGSLYIEAFEALFNRPDRRADLRRVRAPALVIRGENDGWISAERATELADGLTGAGPLVTIPGAAHIPTLTHPVEVAATIGSFLEDMDTR
ncbi:MAG: alpha/beta hydrolase [Acidimicrobiales bacterium]